ncbi:MAG TPA: HDOD domain-containing protein [Leptospiraceae bacterium]|nr:HDOD domain-containing protein [Leptospiraceae bacterium]HMW06423.1 HDOD domain-containing protein [Leptospiraceae bacterium]HMX31511.1 HDOD domain-containing protein [Leptospiraceae bacterium]HMY31951.1 HDOD domain-containing protein [Leptospiraceae bacterium]HMZ63185.1 HDOD domain-containing protein [Leptospiraceae bacterium]
MNEDKIPVGINPENLKPFKIITAEDSMIDRSLLRMHLQSEKFDIIYESTTGEDLLFYLQESLNKPDMICVDVNMAAGNGIEIIQKIRSSYKNIKIAVVSAASDKNIIQSLIQLKIDTFIKKPYNRMQIVQKLSQALGRKEDTSVTKDQIPAVNINFANLVIPPLPAVAVKITTFDIDNPSGGSEELEKIISPDKSITMDIMKIANSSFYGRSGKVHTLKDAITLLGTKTVKNLVLLQSNKQVSKKLKGDIFQKNLQELPILSALIAHDISIPLGMKSFKDDLFLSALLKKIGMTILALTFTERYEQMIKQATSESKDIYALEKEAFSFDHIDVGSKVFKIWNMPKGLQDAVAHQNFTAEDMGKVSHVDRITRLAGLLAYQMVGYELREEEKKLEENIFQAYNATDKVKESFQKEYYDLIKDHPFFEMLA